MSTRLLAGVLALVGVAALLALWLREPGGEPAGGARVLDTESRVEPGGGHAPAGATPAVRGEPSPDRGTVAAHGVEASTDGNSESTSEKSPGAARVSGWLVSPSGDRLADHSVNVRSFRPGLQQPNDLSQAQTSGDGWFTVAD